jgi:beta-galactosidase
LVTHWNHSSDSVTLYVFSNLEKVDIYLNERIINSLYTSDFPGNVISLKVPYEKGTIRAFASEQGKSAVHELFTTGNPVKIHAEAIEYPDYKDYDNIIQYIVSIRDEKNNLCPVSGINILTEYDENIRFLGADNGDMSDHQLFTEDSRTVRDGQCLFIFKRIEKEKEFELRFEAEGLEPFIVYESN